MTPEKQRALADVLALIRARQLNELTADERTLALAAVEARAALDEARRERDEARNSEQLMAARMAECLSVLPRPNEEQSVTWKSAPGEALNGAATWAVEAAGQVMRRELEHHPAHKRNRLTVAMFFGADRWNLTLARGDYEHHVEAQRNEARQEVCALLDGHLSPSDTVRLDAITRATAARRGWGM